VVKKDQKPLRKAKPDPSWVEPYLAEIAKGHSARWAAVLCRVARRTAEDWFAADEKRRERLTRARDDRTGLVRNDCMEILRTHAIKGSAWHLARYWAWGDPEGWKRIGKVLAEADPQRVSLDHGGDGSAVVSLAQLVELAGNGGFSRQGSGSEESKQVAESGGPAS